MKVRRQFESVRGRNRGGERAVQIKPLREKQKPHLAAENSRELSTCGELAAAADSLL